MAAAIEVSFSPYPKYTIDPCAPPHEGSIAVDLPAAVEKIWKFVVTELSTKDSMRVQIFCNSIELVNHVVPNNNCNALKEYLGETIEMQFSQHFDYSDYYRVEPRGTFIKFMYFH